MTPGLCISMSTRDAKRNHSQGESGVGFCTAKAWHCRISVQYMDDVARVSLAEWEWQLLNDRRAMTTARGNRSPSATARWLLFFCDLMFSRTQIAYFYDLKFISHYDRR
jgi:hypothetical protein